MKNMILGVAIGLLGIGALKMEKNVKEPYKYIEKKDIWESDDDKEKYVMGNSNWEPLSFTYNINFIFSLIYIWNVEALFCDNNERVDRVIFLKRISAQVFG